jgi:benzodiazapine receptor
MRWISLLGWLALCFSVAGISGLWTAKEIPTWYRTLRRPAIAPPNWIFGPVWSLLYALMAIAAWLVSQTPPSTLRTVALALFLLQLALNFAWSWLFFHLHRIGLALLENLLLWAAIAATVAAFFHLSRIAGWLLVPYIAWVSFAILLNFEFWRKNKQTSPPPAS